MVRSLCTVLFSCVALSTVGCRVEPEPEYPHHGIERREVVVHDDVEHHEHHDDHDHDHDDHGHDHDHDHDHDDR